MDIICDRHKCCGCGLCHNLCPVNAIKMVTDFQTGHFVPKIDKKKCINCNKCKLNCVGNKKPKFYNNIKCYAAILRDNDEQKGSSSGGIAYSFYKKAIEKGWYVVGTILDENMKAKMEVTNSIDDIYAFKGSKYVQVDTNTIYKKIDNLINKEKKNVLFIGLPCQCEAARTIAKDNKERILTIDLICHGVPSQKSLKDYIEMIENRKRKKITSVIFRTNWGEEMILFSKNKKVWQRRLYWDCYLKAFNDGILINETCFNCKYASSKRTSDITIGDFWGINKDVYKYIRKGKISVVGINTKKGLDFFNDCDDIEKVERDWNEAVNGNSQLQKPINKNKKYDTFWNNYNKYNIKIALKKTIYDEVEKRYRKEYPKIWIKNKIKKLLIFHK